MVVSQAETFFSRSNCWKRRGSNRKQELWTTTSNDYPHKHLIISTPDYWKINIPITLITPHDSQFLAHLRRSLHILKPDVSARSFGISNPSCFPRVPAKYSRDYPRKYKTGSVWRRSLLEKTPSTGTLLCRNFRLFFGPVSSVYIYSIHNFL